MAPTDDFPTRLERATAEHIAKCDSLAAIKSKAKEHLALIGRGRTFKNYTDHGIAHSERMLSLAERLLIPPDKLDALCADSEACTLLVLGAYLHDIGMFVAPDEEDTILAGKQSWWPGEADILFEDFCRRFAADHRADIVAAGIDPDHLPEDYKEHVVLEEFIRRYHPRRAERFLRDNQLRRRDGKIEPLLSPALGPALHDNLAQLCRSHGEPIPEFVAKKLPPRLPDLQYVACVLRLADLLDLSRHRAPARQFVYLQNPTNTTLREWWRQITSEEPVLDGDTLLVKASFAERDDPDASEHYRALMDYLRYIEQELADSRTLLGSPTRPEGGYALLPRRVHMPPQDDPDNDPHIRCQDFSAKTYKFELAADKIINLLMGENIYEKPAMAVREVLFNAIDATRRFWNTDSPPDHPMARIDVLYETTPQHFPPYGRRNPPSEPGDDPYFKHHRLVIRDFGVGMTRYIIDHYFCQIGRSYYTDSPDFDRMSANFTPISRFGVGILSLFMLCDRAQVTTQDQSAGSPVLQLDIRHAHRHFVTRELEREAIYPNHPDWRHGTEVRMWLKPQLLEKDSDEDLNPVHEGRLDIERIVRHWCRQIGFPIHITVEGSDSVLVTDQPDALPDGPIDFGRRTFQIVKVPIKRQAEGVTGMLFYAAAAGPTGCPVPTLIRDLAGPEEWSARAALAPSWGSKLLNAGVLCDTRGPAWAENPLLWHMDVRRPAELTPFLNRTGVKEDQHWHRLNNMAAEAFIRHVVAAAEAAFPKDPVAAALAVQGLLQACVDDGECLRHEAFRAFVTQSLPLPFLSDGQVVARTIPELARQDTAVLSTEWAGSVALRGEEPSIIMQPVFSTGGSAHALLPFLHSQLRDDLTAPAVVACTQSIAFELVKHSLWLAGYRRRSVIAMLCERLCLVEWSRQPAPRRGVFWTWGTAGGQAVAVQFEEWRASQPGGLCRLSITDDGRLAFALNSSWSQIRVLERLLRANDKAPLTRAARETAGSIAMAHYQNKGPGEPNELMGALHNLAARLGVPLGMSKEEFRLTENDIPSVEWKEWKRGLWREYGPQLEAWLQANGEKLPEYYEEYFEPWLREVREARQLQEVLGKLQE